MGPTASQIAAQARRLEQGKVLLALIGVVAFLLRWLHHRAAYYSPYGDMVGYLEMSRTLFFADFWRPYPAFPLGYPLLLRCLEVVSGSGDLAPIRLLQMAASTATVVLLGVVATRLFSRGAGLWAALIAAFYWTDIAFTTQVMTETLSVFLQVLLCFIFTGRGRWQRLPAGARVLALLGCGGILGLAVNMRSNLVTLALPFALLVAWVFAGTSGRRTWKPALIAASTFLAGFALVCVPASVRHTVLLGRPAFVALNGPINMMIGHNEHAAGRWMTWAHYSPRDQRLTAEASKVGQLERMAVDARIARDFAREHPVREVLDLIPARATALMPAGPDVLAFSAPGHPLGENPFGPGVRVPTIPAAWLLPLALVGIIAGVRRHPAATAWLLLYLACGLGPILLVFGDPRFRVVFDFVLILLAASALARCRPARWRPTTAPLLVLLLLVAASVAWSAVRRAEIGGPELLPAAREFGPPADDGAAPGELEVLVPRDDPSEGILRIGPAAAADRPLVALRGRVPLDGRSATRALLRFRYRVDAGPDRALDPALRAGSLTITFNPLDAEGRSCRLPGKPHQFLGPNHPVNAWQWRWRSGSVLAYVPARTRTLEFEVASTLPVPVELDFVSLRSSWWSGGAAAE